MPDINSNQCQKIMREKGIYAKSSTEWSKDFNRTDRTIRRWINKIIKQDIASINRENTIYKLLYKLREIEKQCTKLSESATETTKVRLLRLRTDICTHILNILQDTGTVDRPAQKIDLTMKEEILRIVTPKERKKIVIKDEDLE